jgi:uncharacterized protein YkwD
MKYIVFIIMLVFYPICFLFPVNVVNIYPVEKMQTAGIYVKKGEILKFEVTGQWSLWNKYKPVGGEGHQFIANEFGNWGALLGKIGNGEPFIIGNGREITSEYEGVLYLFPNKGIYKTENHSGNLTVSIEGGLNIQDFKNQLSSSGNKYSLNANDKIIITDLYIEAGEKLEIYAFGEWTMWDGIYSEVSAEGHDFAADGVPWGKLYGGIGASYGEFLEIFPVGEKTQYVASKSGVVSLFPYLNNFSSNEKGVLDIYIIGGRKASNSDIEKTDNLIRQKTEAQVLARINEIRIIASLPKLDIDPVLSKSASDHAKYLVLNNKFAREEDSRDQYFTGANLKDRLEKLGYTRKAREMFCQAENPISAVDLFMNTVYHRLRLLNPDLKYFGYGTYKLKEKEIHVFDFGYLKENEEKFNWDVIIYPANNFTDVKTSWSGEENPNPFPFGTQKPLGSPVTIKFKEKINSIISAELVDETGNRINSFIITPVNDINKKNFNAVIIVPKEVLKNNYRYVVKIKANIGENIEKDYSWSFITEMGK